MGIAKIKPKLLLLGGNSQIAQAWLRHSSIVHDFDISYTSRTEVSELKIKRVQIDSLNTLPKFEYVINFVGASQPNQIKVSNPNLEFAMNQAHSIAFEVAKRGGYYIFMSSGSVYKSFPGDGSDLDEFSSSSSNFYIRHKRECELEYRKFSFGICILRIFGFVSSLREPPRHTLLGDMWNAWRHQIPMATNETNPKRDIVGDTQVSSALDILLSLKPSQTFDIFSAEPASKTELAEALGLGMQLANANFGSPTGEKTDYFSNDRKLMTLGYSPHKSSVETVLEAFSALGYSKN
jgi:nucleoside-diphosphate-sugar epimerase